MRLLYLRGFHKRVDVGLMLKFTLLWEGVVKAYKQAPWKPRGMESELSRLYAVLLCVLSRIRKELSRL